MTDRLPDKLESNGRVEVRVDGTVVGTRRIIDFVSSGGNADDGGLNDKVTVDMSTFGGDSLWESVAGDLHPITNPDTFTLSTVTGNITVTAAAAAIIASTAYYVKIDAATDVTISSGADISGDAQGNMVWGAEGTLNLFANGSEARLQCNNGNLKLYASDVLEVGDGLHFDGEAVATGPVGNIIGKIRVVELDGDPHGWIPVYDAIT